MHLREYTRHDVSSTVTIQNAAFLDDAWWAFVAPHRKDYPQSWRAVITQSQHISLLNPCAYNLVCVADAGDRGRLRLTDGSAVVPGAVLGYARWERRTSSPLSDPYIVGQKASLWHSLERSLRRIEAWYTDHIAPNPVYSHENMAHANRRMATSQFFSRLKDTPHWHLAGLAVGPEFQGKGVARMLVSWGIDRCLEETPHTDVEDGLPDPERVCTLISRPAGRWLYEKAGFRALCSRTGEILNLGIADVGQDSVMIWDPTGAWTEESSVPSTYAEGLKDYVKWREGS